VLPELLPNGNNRNAQDTVIVRDAASFQQQLEGALSASGSSGFDIVFDSLCGRFFEPAHGLLAVGGRHVVFGAADLTPRGDSVGWLRIAWQYVRRPRLDPMAMIGQNRAVLGFNLIWMFDKVELLADLVDGLASLSLPPPHIGEELPFEQAQEAIRRLQSGTTRGKVVLTLG